jgi:hypothetical protein
LARHLEQHEEAVVLVGIDVPVDRQVTAAKHTCPDQTNRTPSACPASGDQPRPRLRNQAFPFLSFWRILNICNDNDTH